MLRDFWFQAFKGISVQSLADHYQAQTSVATRNKDCKLYSISLGKLLNKLQQQQEPGGQGSGFHSCHIILFKISIFLPKL